MHHGPVEVAQDAYDAVALSERIVEKTGVRPTVDRQEDHTISESRSQVTRTQP